ncbi:MAG: DUF5821 family protein, partial [Halobacteriaceae archaeon]
MNSNLFGKSVNEIITSVISTDSDRILVVNPSTRTISEIVDVLTDSERPRPTVKILANEQLLRKTMEDFLIASRAANLVASDDIVLKTSEELPRNSLFVLDELLISMVELENDMAGLRTDDDSFVQAANSYYTTQWQNATQFELRTPPLEEVYSSLSTDIGPETQSDFADVLASLETARGDENDLDEVTVSLLVAAKN